MKHIFHINGKAALLEIPKGTTSETWGEIQTRFQTTYGTKEDWLDCLPLWPHCLAANLPFHEELASSQGVSIILIQFSDTTEEQVTQARQHLERSRDIVRLTVLKITELVSFSLTPN